MNWIVHGLKKHPVVQYESVDGSHVSIENCKKLIGKHGIANAKVSQGDIRWTHISKVDLIFERDAIGITE